MIKPEQKQELFNCITGSKIVLERLLNCLKSIEKEHQSYQLLSHLQEIRLAKSDKI